MKQSFIKPEWSVILLLWLHPIHGAPGNVSTSANDSECTAYLQTLEGKSEALK